MQTLDRPEVTDTTHETDLNHYYCSTCYPDHSVALCGTNLLDCEEVEEWEEIDCVVCIALDETHPCDS